MAVPDHPMSALKGTQQARDLMSSVRAHKTTPDVPAVDDKPVESAKPHGQAAYDEIIARHTSRLPKR